MSGRATARRTTSSRPAEWASAARAALRRVPRAARLCALVAVLNGVAWSLVTPLFQVVDEPSHYSYTEYLVDHGRPPPPAGDEGRLSLSESAAFRDLRVEELAASPGDPALVTETEQRRLERDLARYRGRDGNGASQSAEPEPPLYYVLAAVPFTLGLGGDVLDRLWLVRLLSTLLSGGTVLLVYLFLREALPAHPWAWTVGALGVAFEPLFACMSGGANPDNLLYLVAAGLFLAFARIFRRGLTRRRAVGVGALIAIGFLTKINFVGLLPGALLGLFVAGVREEGALRWRALRLPALGVGVAAAPIALEMALNVLAWDRAAFGSGVYTTGGVHYSLSEGVRYLWEFYLPALPFVDRVATGFSLYDIWFRGFVGEFGWLDTVYPSWVYRASLVPFAIVLALLGSALVRERRALRERLAELLVYGALAAGLLALIALASYNLFAQRIGGAAEPRYLLPLLALYGAVLTLAVRGAGARWMPVVGTALVVLAFGHDVFGLLLEVARYHG